MKTAAAFGIWFIQEGSYNPLYSKSLKMVKTNSISILQHFQSLLRTLKQKRGESCASECQAVSSFASKICKTQVFA